MQRNHTFFIIALSVLLAAGMLAGCAPKVAAAPEAAVASEPEASAPAASMAETAPVAASAAQGTPAAFADTPHHNDYESVEIAFGETSPAVPFTTKTFEGTEFNSEAEFAKAKVTMLVVWSTTCGPCISSLPEWNAINEAYKGTGFQIVGVCADAYGEMPDSVKNAKDVAAEAGGAFTQLQTNEEIYSGLLSNVMYTPTSIFVDSTGKQICPYVIGGMREGDWINTIETIMHEKP